MRSHSALWWANRRVPFIKRGKNEWESGMNEKGKGLINRLHIVAQYFTPMAVEAGEAAITLSPVSGHVPFGHFQL
ncbi:MAG: hypothetical protein ABSB71_13480 [Candidatus Bathyarchaeia archaeon]|jgi:hypothetical protein